MPAVDSCLFQGLPAVRLVARDGGCAVITLQGGQLVSWVAGHEGAQLGEQLYLSPRSRFEAGHPIRGGVPVIFPQFGAQGPLPRHGFARTSLWAVSDARLAGGAPGVTLRLDSSAQTRESWPFDFRCELAVTLADACLVMTLSVVNRGARPFSFMAALHGYWRVGALESVTLCGLQNSYFEQAAHAGQRVPERSPVLRPRGPLDRIYYDTPGQLSLQSDQGRLHICQQGFADVVVWNPGPVQAAMLHDLPPNGFNEFLCVEAAAIGQAPVLAGGARWEASQTVRAVSCVARRG